MKDMTKNNATVIKNAEKSDTLQTKTATLVPVEGLSCFEIIDNEGWMHKIYATSYGEACKMLREGAA